MNFINKTIVIVLISLIVICPAFGMKQASEYEENQCELIAKDFQREHGGSLIFMQPLKSNGAWDLGAYNGHMINKYYNYSQKKELWIDYGNNLTFNSSQETEEFFEMVWDKDYVMFDLGQEHPPFHLIWHY